jgi:hypothetical protein
MSEIIGFTDEQFEIQFLRSAKPRKFWRDELTVGQIGQSRRVMMSNDETSIADFFAELLAARAVDKKPITEEETKAFTPSMISKVLAKLSGTESDNPKSPAPPQAAIGEQSGL